MRINLEKGPSGTSPLFAAIPHRQCARAGYNGQSASAADLRLLEGAATGGGGGVLMLTDRARMETVAEYVAEGNVAQLGDPHFVKELTTWIRFNTTEAERRGDGLFGPALGIPVIPRWLGKIIMRTVVSAHRQNDRDITNVRSSGGIAVFVSEANDKAHWIDVGRRYERFALQATALGLRNAFVNQPVEVPRLRQQFAGWLGLGRRRPDLIVRFGYGPDMPRSLRRPLSDIVVSEAVT